MKVKLYTYWEKNYRGELEFNVRDFEYYPEGSIAGPEFEIELDVTPPNRADVVKAEVAALRAKQGTLQAEITKIESQIQDLMCLEFKDDANE